MSLLPAPPRYAQSPSNPDLVYDALCETLSDRADRVDWPSFTDDDWTLLPRMAQTEGVAPLIHWKLKEASAAPIPPRGPHRPG